MTMEELISLAKECGFTAAGPLDASTIQLKQEVRDMCASGNCGAYGKNWTCPPACGDLDQCAARIAEFEGGIILQTTGELEDELDYETMMDTGKLHKENFKRFMEKIRAEYPKNLGLAAGGCTMCEKCNYPEPCRFPEKAFSSMEGYGMVVSETCTANNMPYYYGPNTITYVACCLLY